ncbi:MAG TPA: TMEM165/GDT1 family protein [Candidatus Saccharimonadales bacterium]|nr:TMEM165/GDT1 family protein [Candidatus Saccharimonadales bacterium]
MDIGIITLVFGVIFIAELPDKSLFASLVLGTKYRGWYVWLGAAAAFLVHVVLAITAGKALTLLPHNVVEIIVALLFLAGGLLLLFGKHGVEEEETHPVPKSHRFWKVFGTSFAVVFVGEWGDITQITTANYAAHYQNALSVGLGATLGLWAVTAFAIVAGRRVVRRIPARLLQRITATILLSFAAYSFVRVFR